MIFGPSCTPNKAPAAPRQLLVLGPPGTRRMELLLAAARAAGWDDLHALGYPEAIGMAPPPSIRWPPRPLPSTLVRLDSPQDDLPTTRCILKLGITPAEAAGHTPLLAADIERFVPARGELVHPLQWFLGLRALLEKLACQWEGCVSWMSHPRAVALLFDKAACRQHWAAAGLPVPHSPASPRGYAELREQVPARHARLFVKLRYGYAAAGAMALEWYAGRVRAITTLETACEDGRMRLFVSRRPRVVYQEGEVARLVDLLARHEIVVEEWLPKARWQGRPFDVRAVLVRGRLRHVVGRAAASPFTNLNLGARRIAGDLLMRHLRDWESFVWLVEAAAACFPEAGTLGLDVLVRPCRRRMVLLEANAFGDYLPGLLHAGMTTYEAAFRAWRDA